MQMVQFSCNLRTEGLGWARQGESICCTDVVEALKYEV